MEPVGDDRSDVKAALQHYGHLVPGFVHFPAVNAFDREHVEYDRFPVDRYFLRGYAQHCDFSTVAHVVDHVAECRGVPGHLEPDVKTLLHAELPLALPKMALSIIRGVGPPILFRKSGRYPFTIGVTLNPAPRCFTTH